MWIYLLWWLFGRCCHTTFIRRSCEMYRQRRWNVDNSKNLHKILSAPTVWVSVWILFILFFSWCTYISSYIFFLWKSWTNKVGTLNIQSNIVLNLQICLNVWNMNKTFRTKGMIFVSDFIQFRNLSHFFL